jgi:hypothetical protein
MGTRADVLEYAAVAEGATCVAGLAPVANPLVVDWPPELVGEQGEEVLLGLEGLLLVSLG